jgi:hypothetical protein
VNDADVTKLHPAKTPQLKKLIGMGGGWDYITEENAEASIGLLPGIAAAPPVNGL